MADDRTNTDMAKEVVEILRALSDDDLPSGPNDPQLDDLSKLILAASKRPGFVAELGRQMEEAGSPIPPLALLEISVLAATSQSSLMDKKAHTSASKQDSIFTQPVAVRKAARALYQARLDRQAGAPKQATRRKI